MVAFYYGMMVPWYRVHYRDVESCRREGDRTVIGLAGNSSLDIDWKNKLYTVTVNGAGIARKRRHILPGRQRPRRVLFHRRAGS